MFLLSAFVEPLRGNEKAVGFDLASNPARLAALERARDSGQLTVTAPIRLVQEAGHQFGFLAFAPVYGTNPVDSIEARRSELQGFALGVVSIETMVDSVGNRKKKAPFRYRR